MAKNNHTSAKSTNEATAIATRKRPKQTYTVGIAKDIPLTRSIGFRTAGVFEGMHTGILTISANKPESHMTPLEKMAIADGGITKKDLELLKLKSALGYDQLAKVLSVARATLINKKKEEKFNPALSERIMGLADIYSYGYEVFEDEERFNQWMSRPNQALGGKSPYELINNQFGREEVRNIIGRIDYGVYS